MHQIKSKPAILTALALLALLVSGSMHAGERRIFPAPEMAESDIAAALQSAAATHRRVVLDFGGDWCVDCQVLDIFLHDAANRPILEANYVLVHVNIGQLDRNLDIAARYDIPIAKGVPALAVLDEHGELLYSQRAGEFEAMSRMRSKSVTSFLEQWKPANHT
ncbi:MAG TPA: thioredoxin family protein [Steroidobacteraceae bacterium]|nr:thioredoxin family protein [Steroidobacteraceae bacterium]